MSIAEFETETLHEIFDDEEKWLQMVDNTLEIMRKGTDIGNLPTGQIEELERESRRASDELLRSEQDDLDAAERRKQRKKEKKERRSRTEPGSRAPTVILIDYHAPPEPSSEEEDTTEVNRQLDFEGCASSDVEVKSSPKSVKTLDPKEPQTPEELVPRNQPPSHGVQDV